ncbi:hypothetical protein Tco_0811209 [Tanacetum coccineum]
MLLAQLQEAGIQLNKDQLAILADTRERINFGPGAFTVTTNALFQADGVKVYDSDCDDVPNAQPSFMANISSYGSDALPWVHNLDNVDNNMINHGVHVKLSYEQSSVVNHSETKITSDGNIISYSHQVINYTKINLDNKSVNDSLTAELERYKEQVKVLKEGQNVDLKSKDNVLDSCEQFVEIDRLKQILSEHILVLLVDPPKELSKVSMVNTSLKKLKHHLAAYDVVSKEKNTATSHSLSGIPQSQEKDTVIKKLKERIKSLSGNMNEDNTYKQLYDSIKPACDALITQINAKSVENSDKNAQLQEKVFTITALKEELRKLKGKSVVACRDSVNKPKVIAPVVHKVDMETLSPKLKNNREAHEDYIRITKENADTVRDIVEQARYNTLCFQVIDDVDKSTIHFSVVRVCF